MKARIRSCLQRIRMRPRIFGSASTYRERILILRKNPRETNLILTGDPPGRRLTELVGTYDPAPCGDFPSFGYALVLTYCLTRAIPFPPLKGHAPILLTLVPRHRLHTYSSGWIMLNVQWSKTPFARPIAISNNCNMPTGWSRRVPKIAYSFSIERVLFCSRHFPS